MVVVRFRLLQVTAAIDTDGFTRDEIAVKQRQHRLGNLDLTAPSAERRGLLHRTNFLIGR